MKLLARFVVALVVYLCFINAAFAARAANIEGGTLFLDDAVCADNVIEQHILPEWYKKFKAGRAVITDKQLAAQLGAEVVPFCWLQEEDLIFGVNPKGGQFALPAAMFEAPAKGL
jgi:hypothetical protein